MRFDTNQVLRYLFDDLRNLFSIALVETIDRFLEFDEQIIGRFSEVSHEIQRILDFVCNSRRQFAEFG